MKKFSKFLTILLCLELVISPVAPHFSFISVNGHASECPQGLVMDTNLNRCLSSVDSANILNATSGCAKGDAECYRKNAEDYLKEKELGGDVENQADLNKDLKKAAKFVTPVAIAAPLSVAIIGLKDAKSSCASTSYWALVTGGVSLAAGQYLSEIAHKKRLKKIEEDWENIVKPSAKNELNKDQQKINATEAQSMAFEMLARSEDSMEKAAQLQKNLFAVAMSAFSAASLLAGLELLSKTGICAPKTSSINSSYELQDLFNVSHKIKKQQIYNLKNSKNFAEFYSLNSEFNSTNLYSTIQDYEQASKLSFDYTEATFQWIKKITVQALESINPIKSAISQVQYSPKSKLGSATKLDTKIPPSTPSKIASRKVTSPQNSSATKNAIESLQNRVSKTNLSSAPKDSSSKLNKFLTNPISRSVLGGILATWSGVMFKHAKDVETISKKRSTLLRGMKEEFNLTSGAIQVCNPRNRNDPSVPNCYCYTPEGARNSNRSASVICQKLFSGLTAKSQNYYGTTPERLTGCISSNREVDENCQCRESNTCMKTSTGTFRLNPSTMSAIAKGIDPINQIANGTYDQAKVDSNLLANNALRLQESAKALKDQNGNNILADTNKLIPVIENELKREAASAGSNSKAAGLFGDSAGGLNLPSNPGEAARMLEKEIETNGPSSIGQENSINPNSSPAIDIADFGLNEAQKNEQDNQISEVMKEDLDYGQNEINSQASSSIFEVLSNRYKQSGMRRLFDEDLETKQPQKEE